MTVIYSVAIDSGISCFYERKNISKYRIDFTDLSSELSLALAQLMMLIVVAKYDFSLRVRGVNKINFTNANALAMAVNPSLIPETFSEKKEIIELLKSRFEFSFSLHDDLEIKKLPQNVISASIDMHRWHGLSLKKIKDFYYFSCLQYEVSKIFIHPGESPLNEDGIINKFIAAEKASEKKLFHTFISDSETYAGNGFFRLKYFSEDSCAIVMSKNHAQTDVLIALFRTSEDQYYSSALSIIKRCCGGEANIYADIAQPKIKFIRTKQYEALGKALLNLQVNTTDRGISYYYKLRIYCENNNLTPISCHYGIWENSNPGPDILLRDLWVILRSHWLEIDGKSLEIYTNSGELRRSVYTPQVSPVSGFLWSLLNMRFPTIQILSSNFTGQLDSPSSSCVSDHGIDAFVSSLPLFYIKGIGQAVMSLHAVRRYIQREMELSGKLIHHPFKKLSSMASSMLWRDMSPSEIRQYRQNDHRARILINDETGWMLVLADQSVKLHLMTVYNINLKYTKER